MAVSMDISTDIHIHGNPAFITILSSRVILTIKMYKRGYYSTVLFLQKTGIIRKILL